MTQYDNTNTGGLWPSEQKTEKHPNLKGGKYLSLAVDKPIEKEPSPTLTSAVEALPF
jgi:hypothetical protein